MKRPSANMTKDEMGWEKTGKSQALDKVNASRQAATHSRPPPHQHQHQHQQPEFFLADQPDRIYIRIGIFIGSALSPIYMRRSFREASTPELFSSGLSSAAIVLLAGYIRATGSYESVLRTSTLNLDLEAYRSYS